MEPIKELKDKLLTITAEYEAAVESVADAHKAAMEAVAIAVKHKKEVEKRFKAVLKDANNYLTASKAEPAQQKALDLLQSYGIDKQLQPVLDLHCVTIYDLIGKGRQGYLVEIRQIVTYLLYTYHPERRLRKPSRLAQLFCRDHATILHSVKTTAGYLEVEPSFRTKVHNIAELMNIKLDETNNPRTTVSTDSF